jgi:SAM-dependent methyltransferase
MGDIAEGGCWLDLGCGSGWAYFVAPRVGVLHCIDPSMDVFEGAKVKRGAFSNCRFRLAAADSNPPLMAPSSR